LLNVGPDPRGVIPKEAQIRLKGIGEWMKVNGESVYGTGASPFPAKPSWGKITAKNDTLYLHVYDWNENITLTGIKSKVSAITLLADPGREITWTQKPCDSLGYDKLAILLKGEEPDSYASVLKVQFENNMQVETRIIEDDAGCIELPTCLANIHSLKGKPEAEVNMTGVVRNWFSTEDWFSWEFLCMHPGEYEATVTISTGFHGIWDFGHQAILQFNGQENLCSIEDTGIPTGGYQKRIFNAGRFRIDTAGLHRISIKASNLSRTNGQGFQMSTVNLQPRNDL
jgi:alpha-L-fucosidase